jgi:hypothetical protein
MWSRVGAAVGGISGLVVGVTLALTGATPLGSIGTPRLNALVMGVVFWAAGVPLGFAMGFFLGAMKRIPTLSFHFTAIAAGAAVLFFSVQVTPIRYAYILREDGVKTQAKVVEVRPNQGNEIRYQYSTPRGVLTAWNKAPGAASDLSPGDTVEIYYSAQRPEISTARPPTKTWWAEIGHSVGIGSALSFFSVIVLYLFRSGGNPFTLP